MNKIMRFGMGVLCALLSFAAMADDVTFETGGDALWFAQSAVTYDGTSAWQVGDLAALGSDDYVDSTLTITVQGPCTLSFQYGVEGASSSCDCYLDSDYVSLQRDSWSDSLSWTLNTITISEAGEHTIEFSTYYCSSWYSESYTPSKFWIANVQRIAAPAGVTVSFDANGGTCATSEQYYETGYEYGELPTPTRAQGEFLGWYTAAIGGEKVSEDDVVKFDITQLYARWGLPIEKALGVGTNVTVEVDRDWETGDPNWYGNIDLSYDGEGCACAGFDDNDSKCFYVTVNGPGTLSFVARCENGSLSASIQKQVDEYTYRTCDLAWLYSANSYGSAQTYSVEGFKVSMSYTRGWVRFDIEVYGAGEQRIEFCGYRQTDAGDSYALVDDMSWTPASGSAVVQFEYLDNQYLSPRVYSAGETYGAYGALPEPTRTGYVFAGWCTDEELVNQVKTSDYVPFSGAHLYAKWKKTLAYDNENWYESEETYTTGDKVYRTDVVTNGCVGTQYYTYPTSYLEFDVSGAGFFSFWLAMASAGYTTCTITVDGEQIGHPVYNYDYLNDELTLTNWKKQNLTISGSGKHTVRIAVTASTYLATEGVVLVKDNSFEKYAQQSTFGGWSDKTKNYNCWITGNLPTLQKTYAKDTTPKGRVLHAITTLLTMGENTSFQSLFKGFGYTIDYMNMDLVGTRSYASAPTGNKIVDTLITVGEPLIKTALSDLEAIPATMAEFDLSVDDCAYFDEGVKIDYGDILYMRAALKGLLGFAYWSKAYNVEIDYDQMQKDGYGVPLQTVSGESSLKTEAAWDKIDWLAPCNGEGYSGRSPFKAVKSGSSIYVFAPHEEGVSLSSCYISFANSATGKSLSGNYYNYGDSSYYPESTVSLVADFDAGSVFRLDVSQFSGVKIANVYLKNISSYAMVSDAYWGTSSYWKANVVEDERFVLHQTKIMDKVRTSTALTTARNYIKEGLQIWQQADAKVVARTCDCLHLVEYDQQDETASRHIAAMRRNLPKALQSLNDRSEQEYEWVHPEHTVKSNSVSGPHQLVANINKLFTGEITRSVLPPSASTDYYVPTIYEMDPTLNGLLPETTRTDWCEWLDSEGIDRTGVSSCEFAYYENSDGTITLIGIDGKAPTGVLEVPAEVNGCTVSAIGEGFLEGATGITSVTVPEGVLEIGREAFAGCAALATVTFPSTLDSIGEVPFLSCKNLKTVNFLGSEPSVGESMYWLNEDDDTKLVPATTYVQPDMGWDSIVSTGTWQGRPIKMKTNIESEYGPYVPGEKVSEIVDELIGYTAKGLPTGLKFDSKTGTISGTPTKPTGDAGVTVTFTKKGEETLTAQFIVGPLPKLAIETDGSGTVKGAGSYAANAKVSLKATAGKGFVFAGWYESDDGQGLTALPGTVDYRTASYSYVMPTEDVTLYAKFVSSSEDTELAMENLEDAYEINSAVEMQFSVRSYSLPTVKASGLPTGLKFDAKTLVLSGTPTKPGKYTVTFTLSNLSVKNITQSTVITVPNIVSDKIVGIESDENYYNYMQGVSIGEGIEPEVEEGYTLSVSGLPKGLSCDKKTGKITGTPTAAPGAYTVVFTAKKKGAATETATITINVEAAPISAGTVFNGFVGREEGSSFVNLGTLKLTSAANGALSAVIETANGKSTLTANGWSDVSGDVFKADLSDKSGNRAAIEIDIAKSFDAWQLTGSFYEKKSGTTYSVTAQMNVFGQSWYFKATKVEDESNSWTLDYADSASSADFTVTMRSDGTATAKGKIGAYIVNATSFLATDGLKSGAFLADFVQFVTVSGKKSPLSIRVNLWLDGSDAHDEGAGSARVEE